MNVGFPSLHQEDHLLFTLHSCFIINSIEKCVIQAVVWSLSFIILVFFYFNCCVSLVSPSPDEEVVLISQSADLSFSILRPTD